MGRKRKVKMTYAYKMGMKLPVPAEVVGSALTEIAEKSGGRFDPKDVVEAARPISAPLHPLFEWDDTIAAERFRQRQAGDLIRSVVVVTDDSIEDLAPIRAFVSISEESDRGYAGIVRVMSDADLRRQLLGKALDELEGWQKRYRELTEFASLFGHIEEVKQAVVGEAGAARNG